MQIFEMIKGWKIWGIVGLAFSFLLLRLKFVKAKNEQLEDENVALKKGAEIDANMDKAQETHKQEEAEALKKNDGSDWRNNI